MFNTLLESKKKKQRNLTGSLTSAVIHLALVGAAVLTSQATGLTEQKAEEEVNYVAPKKEEPPPPKDLPPPVEMPKTPPPAKGFQTLTAPIDIPTVIPTIDLTARVTNELDFSGQGVKGGVAAGVVGGTGKVDSDQPFFSYEVEKMARLVEGSGPSPAYPNILRQTKQTGKVLVQFVVDTTGRADMSTFKIVESSNQLFDVEVKKVLPKYRFVPAEIGSRKVPMYVQLPFEFRLDGGDED
jgi:periplasmic protein TonB